MGMKTYYDELKKKTRYYYGYPGGWEVRVSWEKEHKWDMKIGASREYSTVKVNMPRGMPNAAKKDVRKTIARDKWVAQSVQTRKEYEALWKRIDPENWDYIEENNLKGASLVNWAYNTRTSEEYYNLLRYN